MIAPLAHKAWCETRARFALAAAGLLAAAILDAPFSESTSTLFALLVVLLGGGTARQEQALGTLGFTLALPVSRARLFAARAAVGAAEVLALAALPALVALATGVDGAWTLAAGWAACGLALLATALCVAALVTQELVAWLVTYTLFFAYEALINVTALRRVPALDLYRLMSATRSEGAGPLGTRLAGVIAVALALFWLAQHLQRRERGVPADEAPPRPVAKGPPRFALLHKAWREGRARFRLATLILLGLTLGLIVFHRHFRALGGGDGPGGYAGYLLSRFYAGVGGFFFGVLAILPAIGGLQRERSLGTAGFSLALPVTRDAHVRARALAGLSQVALLAWLPALVVPVVSAAIGQRFPLSTAAWLALSWTLGGGAIYAISFVIGTIVPNEVAAFAAALILLRLAPLGELLGGGGVAWASSLAIAVATMAAAVVLTRRGRFV